MNEVFEGGTLRFAVITLFIWLGAMAFVYLVGGRTSINQWSALGSLAAPGIWLLYRAKRAKPKR